MNKQNNAINTLHPYRGEDGSWYYDDEDLGIYNEAFILGSSEAIDLIVGKDCNNFKMYISSSPIPGYDARILRRPDLEERDEIPGWYQMEGSKFPNWLCSRTLDYFPDYPESIYIKIIK